MKKVWVRVISLVLTVLFVLIPFAFSEEETDDPWYLPLDFSFQNYKADPSAFTEEGYHDESLDITFEEQSWRGITFLIARIRVKSPTQLRTAIAGQPNEDVTVKPSAMARKLNAVLTINADNYTHRNKYSFIYRQGVPLRTCTDPDVDVLVIDRDGDFHIFTAHCTDYPLEEYLLDGEQILQAFSFGPALVIDGQMADLKKDYPYYPNKNTWRSFIAQDGPLSYLFVTSSGGTHEELAAFAGSLNVQNAYNLDGGYSSVMIFNNQYLGGRRASRERAQSDILYVVTAVPD